MKLFYSLLFLSILGIGIVIVDIFYNQMPQEGNSEALPKIILPFKNFVAGVGIVEAKDKNIVLSSLKSGIIKKVFVHTGDSIKKGALLFTLDDSALVHQITVAKQALILAKMKLKVANDQLDIIKKTKKISSQMVTNEKYESKEDNVEVAKKALLLAQTKVEMLEKNRALYKVYAPIDGYVLVSTLNVGAFFSQNSKQLIIGKKAFNLRVFVNEYDIWKFEPNTKAIAFVRGHPEMKVQLHYLYTVPYVVAKTNLTGKSTERTDTRVLQVVYGVTKTDFPLFVGEQLDVFIETSKGK